MISFKVPNSCWAASDQTCGGTVCLCLFEVRVLGRERWRSHTGNASLLITIRQRDIRKSICWKPLTENPKFKLKALKASFYANGDLENSDPGPLLALTVVIAPDTPAFQVLFCQIILLCYMSLQLYHWPWKAPILNVVDFLTCFLITILVVVTAFYIPAVTGDLQQTFQLLRPFPFCFMLARIFSVSPVFFPTCRLGQFAGHL